MERLGISMRKEGLCGVCNVGCRVELEIKDDNILRISPSKIHSPSYLCQRGAYSNEILNAPDRIRTPLIRIGEKGQGKFRKASWDEAIDHVGKGYKKIIDDFGPQALMSHYGRGAFEQASQDLMSYNKEDGKNHGFFAPIGSPNNGSIGSVCYNSYGILASKLIFGFPGKWLYPDIENSEHIIVWGRNPWAAGRPMDHKRLAKAKRRGAKITVIDHFYSKVAGIADNFIPIKTGTDGVLIHTMLKYLHSKKILDYDFIEEYCYGFEEIKSYWDNFSFGICEKLTGVNRETLIGLAEELIAKRTCLMTHTGLEYSESGVQSIRAIYTLWALTGNLDIKGGLLIKPQKPLRAMKEIPANYENIKMIGEDKFPLYTSLTGQPQVTEFPSAVLDNSPYPIRGLLNVGSTITNAYADSHIFERAIKRLDFFVLVDRFMSKDTLYADVVLPATTFYEDFSYMVYSDKIVVRDKLVKRRSEAKSNYEILHLIASSLGYGNYFPSNEKELLDFAFYKRPDICKDLKEKGVYYFKNEEYKEKKWQTGGLREDKKPGFPTKTGKFEIYSILLEENAYEPLPKLTAPVESELTSPDIFRMYPLIMNNGARILSSFRTQLLNIPGLVKLQDRPYALVNPEDAKRRGIRDNDKILVFNRRGQIEVYACVTDKVIKGEIELNYGGGAGYQIDKWRHANVNYLTDNEIRDPISGFPAYRNILCDIKLVKDS